MLSAALFFRLCFFSSRRMEIMREVEEGKRGGGAKSGTLKQTDQRFEKIKGTNLVVGVISSEADASRVLPSCFDDVICGAIRPGSCDIIRFMLLNL